MDASLLEGLGAAGVILGGAFGVNRYRRRNGRSDADKIVAALQDEGRKTRDLTHECHDEMKDLLGGIKTDTEVLRDRGQG